MLLEKGYLTSPCKKHKQLCSVVSTLDESNVMNVLQETVYQKLHHVCSPGEGETPEYDLAGLEILVRVMPTLDEQQLTVLLNSKIDCYDGTNLLKRQFNNLPQDEKDALLVDPPSVDFSCDKECCAVQEVFADIQKLVGLHRVKKTMR